MAAKKKISTSGELQVALHALKKPRTARGLAEALKVSKPTAYSYLDKLKDAGKVKRLPTPIRDGDRGPASVGWVAT